jgi:hypothetical protein
MIRPGILNGTPAMLWSFEDRHAIALRFPFTTPLASLWEGWQIFPRLR